MSEGRLESIQQLRDALRAFADERDWDQFHSPKNLSMALTVEAGELQEHFQWLSEQASSALAGEELAAVGAEMADVFIYLVRLADKLGVDLLQAAAAKLEVNGRRYPADKVRGSARKYRDFKAE
jgi:NTP pyrophosphatase (non-canonical NTP hydrolase)